VSKDTFDIYIGKQLRDAQVPVPSGAWSAIQSQIAPTNTGNFNFGFGLAAVVGTAMLIGLGYYSAVREPQNTGSTILLTEREASQPEVMVEAIKLSQNESESAPIALAETTAGQLATVTFETPANPLVAATETSPIPSEQSLANVEPVRNPPTIRLGSNSGTQVPVSVDKFSEPPKSAGNIPQPETVDSKPSAKIAASAKKGYAPFIVTFENSGHADAHLWDFGALGKMEGQAVTKTFDNPGIYEIALTAFNTAGDTESKFVTIEVKEGSRLFMPSAVYPAGINKTYKVEGFNIKSFHLTVVNSTGKVIFETRNINEVWNVDLPVHESQSEIYIAVVRAEGEDGVVYNQSKSLTIIQ